MFIKLVITLTFATFCSAAAAKDFYVSPSGSDKLNGLSPSVNFWTKTGPFKTLTRARNAIRQLKAAGKFNEAITVHVGKGTYQLQSALEFDDRDSGLPGQQIIWEGEKGLSIISGGMPITNCEQFNAKNPNSVLNCSLNSNVLDSITPEDAGNRIFSNVFRVELFVDGKRMHLARWPNYDWAHIRSPLNQQTKFSVFEQIPLISGNLNNSQVHIFAGNDYYDQYIDIADIDLANNQVLLANQTAQKLASGRRFYLENFESGLDTPAEWYYDKANARIKFIPPQGITAKQVVIPYANNLIKIESTKNIGFKNLFFQYSIDTAITIADTDTVLLDSNEIANIGGKGILGMNSSHTTITNNHLHDLGIGGIFLYGGDRPSLEPSYNLVDNNYIHHYDTILFNYSPAIEVGGVATKVTHNKVEYANGNGIVVVGNDHLIEKNEISQICLQSSDSGAIYSGRNWTYRGNVVRYNYVHDISGYALNGQTMDISKNIIQYINSGARGIYLDDGVSGFTVFGNIISNIGLSGIQLGGGRDTTIENNIIFTDKYGILVDARSQFYDWSKQRESLTTMPIETDIWQEKYPELTLPMHNDTWPEGNTIRRNVIIATTAAGQTFQYSLPKQSNTISDNLVWHAKNYIWVDYNILDTGKVLRGGSWENWLTQGFETNSSFGDPCATISNSKLNIMCANSPLYKIGFQDIPTDIGLRK